MYYPRGGTMSPLGSLFTKADMTVSIDKIVEGRIVARPGDEIKIHVEFTPKKDFYVRQAKVDMIRAETYVDERREYNTEYGGYRKVRFPVTEKTTVLTEVFLEDEDVYAGNRQSADVELALPPGIMPTFIDTPVRGMKPGIFYEVQIILDVPKARDNRQKYELLIV